MHIHRIAVLGEVNFAHASELVNGVSSFAAHRHDWEIIPLHYSQEAALTKLVARQKVDGLIGEIISDRWLQGLMPSGQIPVINTSSQSHILSVPSVLPDDIAIGRLAAEHFLQRNFVSMCFAGMRGYAASTDRQTAFRACAQEHGIDVVELPYTRINAPMKEWHHDIMHMPKPMGLFCVNDHIARRAIHVCKALDLAVPEDVAVIGIGNTTLDSFFAGIGISSIRLPFEEIGYQAARMLDMSLQGIDPQPKIVRVPPTGLTVRETTGTGALHTLVGRAINIIEANLSRPFSVEDLATEMHASRRILELRFRETLGRTPYEEITRQRMRKAQRLLSQSSLSISEIAIRCGYKEVSHFYSRFKALHDNTPPGAWREAHALTAWQRPD
jgi:LacI family transcriptional regulator